MNNLKIIFRVFMKTKIYVVFVYFFKKELVTYAYYTLKSDYLKKKNP